MTTTTISTRNGQISTEAKIIEYSNGGFNAAIFNVYNDERDILQAENFKTLSGAEKYVARYRAKKLAAAERGELLDGVTVI